MPKNKSKPKETEDIHDHEEEAPQESEEQWASKKSKDTKATELESGDVEEDPATEEGREELMEEDEISPEEEGFLKGAEGKGKLGKCAECNIVLDQDEEKVFEREFNDEVIYFCSEKCAKKYAKTNEKKR
jgi:hypothetical protein